MVLVHGHGVSRRHHRPQVAAGIVAREGDEGLEFGIFWKILGAIHEQGRARSVHFETTLLSAADGLRGAHGILHQERREFHQHAVARFGGDLEAPQHRLREGFRHGLPLERVVGQGAVGVVGFHHQNLGAAALELHDVFIAQSPAIEADVVGAHALRQRRVVK